MDSAHCWEDTTKTLDRAKVGLVMSSAPWSILADSMSSIRARASDTKCRIFLRNLIQVSAKRWLRYADKHWDLLAHIILYEPICHTILFLASYYTIVSRQVHERVHVYIVCCVQCIEYVRQPFPAIVTVELDKELAVCGIRCDAIFQCAFLTIFLLLYFTSLDFYTQDDVHTQPHTL